MADKTGIFGQVPDASFFERLISLKYVLLITSFALFLDFCLAKFFGSNLLNVTYAWGDEIPLGPILALLAGFGALSTVVAPKLRAFVGLILLDLRGRVPIHLSDARDSLRGNRSIVSVYEAEGWAATNNNSVVFEMIKTNYKARADYIESKDLYFLVFALLLLLTSYSQSSAVELFFKQFDPVGYKLAMYLTAILGMLFSSWPARKDMHLMFWKSHPQDLHLDRVRE